MAYFIEPGHMALVMLTPEQYSRMMAQRQPNIWPVYFAMSRMSHTIQDLLMKKLQTDNIEALKDHIPLMLGSAFEVAATQKAGGPTGDIAALRADLERIYTGLYDNWKAGVWHGVGAAYSSAMEQFLASGQLLYAYKTLMYHVAVTPRMRRYWNKVYTPMEPDASMAWILHKRGKYSWAEFEDAAAMDGWDATGAAMLRDAFELLPSPREAFYLWTKGSITQLTRDSLYTAGGYDARWHTMITDNWYYTPTLYDLVRLADYIELDMIWTLDAMKRRGVRVADRAKIWEMLQKRPLREEMRAITEKWLWRYKFGRALITELTDAFLDLGIRTKERELLLEKAEMDYEDELGDQMIEILRFRFRNKVITEEEFLAGLIEIPVKQEKANLIVELEKAKGYTGGY